MANATHSDGHPEFGDVLADTRVRSKSKHRSTGRISKNDLQVVAPYLFERRAGKKKKHEKIAKDVVPFAMTDFSMDLADIAQLPQRLHKTANILKQLTESSGVKLYLVDKIYNEIYFCPNGENVSLHRISWNIRSGRTISAHVAFAKEYVLVNDLFADDRFPEGTGWGDPTLTSVICVPIITINEECSAVIELFRENGVDYVPRDLDTVAVVSGWMGSAIEQHQKRIVIKRREDINYKLMQLMQQFVANTDLYEDIISEILNAAKASISAQRGSFYVLNRNTDELETMVYDDALFDSVNTVMLKKLRKKIKGIAWLAVERGELVNIADAYTDPLFDKSVDQKSGFLTRSVLCMPIKDSRGCTGVLQIINKLPAGTFSTTDEAMFGIFGTYLADIVNFKNQYDGRKRSESMTAVYNDIMMNRVKFRLVKKPTQIPPKGVVPPGPADLPSFQWYPFPKYMDRMTDLSYRMLADLIGVHFLNTEATYSFLIAVRKLYRDVCYHNFEHAFVFLHCIYCMLKRYADRFDQVEIMSLMLGALCHDIDHPGCTNSFIKLSSNPLATLYDDSFLENHHYWLGQMVVKNTKVAGMLDEARFARFMLLFRENIIATDLKIHLLDNRIALETMCRIDPATQLPAFDWKNEKHRGLLRGLMMTTSDLAVQFKPFPYVERVVDNLMVEFYMQGDKERRMGTVPIPSMDRSKAALIPEIQVQFLRIVVIPCFDMMRKILPETEVMYTNATYLKSTWMGIIKNRRKA